MKRGRGLAASRHPVEISVQEEEEEEADRRRRREEGEDKKNRKKIKRGRGEEQETENYIAGCFQLIIAATDGRLSQLQFLN